MRLISRHILLTMAAPFCWGLLALTGMLLLNILPAMIERFGGKGLPAGLMVEAGLVLIPSVVKLTLPMAVLVSTLYGYSQLAAALEMVAMYANGISVWRMARPALIGAALVGVADFIVTDQLEPRASIRLNNLTDAALNKSPTLTLQQQALNSLPGPSGYVIRADQIDPETSAMRGVTIFDLSSENRRLIVADSGVMAKSSNGEDLVLTLHSGEIYEFHTNEPGRLQRTIFVHDRVTVRDVENQLHMVTDHVGRGELGPTQRSSCQLLDGIQREKWTMQYQRRRVEYLTARDLHSLADLPQPSPPGEQLQPKFPPHCGAYRRFESWFGKMLLPRGVSAQTPARATQQPVQQPPQQQPPQQQPVQQRPVVPPPGQQPAAPTVISPQGAVVTAPTNPQLLVPPRPPGMLTTSAMEVKATRDAAGFAQDQINRYRVEYHQKFAIPLSTFCFVLIGMALALKYPSSGIGLVIGASLVIFLGFYILLVGGRNVAYTGHLDARIALYTPVVLFTIIGLVAVHSANREMGTARSAGIMASLFGWLRRGKR